MDDVSFSSGRWACDIDSSTMVATCTAFGLSIGEEQVIDFTARIPGTYPDSTIAGYALAEHSGGDPV